ncbi:radical SAM protein [Caloramator sp. E03]|uniref:radical SAM protein n=1 Tax=Caloramator sp. E03 TaxID=2576307 RepID=UPI0011102A94|nr:radical SAM protein [Caloramator sp. E03]QCX34639.1 radical SAM protein [Caloramator sp. E03]
MNLAKTRIGEIALKEAVKYMLKDPENNIPKLINWADKICIREQDKKYVKSVKRYLDDKESNWYKYAYKLFTEVHPNVKEKIGINYFLNATFFGIPIQLENEKKYNCNIPWAILIDPTSACNLKCKGCWAGEYNTWNLSYEELDKIITQGKELGIYMYIFSGGEPLIRKKDIVRLCEKHDDCAFLSFTNGTLVDEEFAKDLQRIGNFSLAFSVEGFKNETDFRRGEGSFDAVMKAMDILKKAGIIFGFSTCYHRYNTEAVASKEYIDLMIEKGCRFGWYFTYVPVGRDSDTDFMATPQQRAFMYKRINEIRATEPIFVLDFWNDGEFSGGCIAGGKRYFHINANGDCEPCAFIHYSNVNIKDHTLLEVLQSPLFMAYRRNIPFNHNHLRPCPLLDNPQILKTMVHDSQAYSTQVLDDETVDELAAKIEPKAIKWAQVAESLWQEKHEKAQNS